MRRQKIYLVRQVLPPLQAVQFKGSIMSFPYEFRNALLLSSSKSTKLKQCFVNNGSGPVIRCVVGDWIVKDGRGYFVVVSKNQFRKLYKKIEE